MLDRYRILDTTSVTAARNRSPLFGRAAESLISLRSDGDFRMFVNSLSLDGIRLSAVGTTGHQISPVDPDNVTVLVPWRGLLITDDGQRHLQVREGEVALPRPGNRRTTIPARYLGLVVQVPLTRLARRATVNPLDWWQPERDWPETLGASTALRRYLRFLVAELDAHDGLVESDRTGRSAATMLTDLLIEAIRARKTGTVGQSTAEASTKHVLRAEEAIRARFGEHITVASLAAELGISTRALQLSFRRHRDAAPREMIADLRLDAAYRRLNAAEPGETVTSIALECGLHHFGRFAARYRARFGESPSVTLARALRTG